MIGDILISLNKLDSSSNIIKLDPELAAHHVIKKADLVISLPWTSPSIIAKAQGKPSCYFDPLKTLEIQLTLHPMG